MRSRHLIKTLLLASLSITCGGEEGPQGPQGPQGEPGPMGAPGNSAATHPDCPIGYGRDHSAMGIVLCRNVLADGKLGSDEVVKVGRKGSAFWIDRYEASVWEKEDGTGKQYGADADDYPSTFPKNGQTTAPLYALSKSGVKPSAYLSWVQANEVCRASGKRLPTGDEWLAAARGTLDPGESDGSGGACLTKASLRMTGGGSKCVGDWGTQDMIGNLWEWTSDWYAGVGDGSTANAWPSSFGNDVTYNIVLSQVAMKDGKVNGLPAAARRGGFHFSGTQAGIFTIGLEIGPGHGLNGEGVRCVVPR